MSRKQYLYYIFTFENAAKKAQMLGEELKIPRLCGQQTQRSNRYDC